MPLFSFIIPVYNVESYLRRCLDSVFSQDFNDFEVCIVDDGSSDRSGEICDEYALLYKDKVTVRLIHQPNQGVSVARNKALEVAQGEYIWFVDADDYISPNALIYLSEIIINSGCDTLFFGNKSPEYLSKKEFFTDERNTFLLKTICYCNPLIIFKREIIENNLIRFTEGIKMGEDLEFQFKYLIYCLRPVSIPYNFYNVRVREGSASRNDDTTYNNYIGSRSMLFNMSEYLKHVNINENRWIIGRVEERLKSYLQSCSVINRCNKSLLNKEFRNILFLFESVGCKFRMGGTLTIAKIDVRLYFALYRILKFIKKNHENLCSKHAEGY